MGRGRRRSNERTVRATRIELVDDAGRVRITMGPVDRGGLGLRILDEHGGTRLWLGLDPSGPVLALGREGNVLVELGVHDDIADLRHSGAYAYLADDDGAPRHGIWVQQPGPGPDSTHDL